ncbi:N-acetylmuramoyl-L-alanine amidase [Bacillus sp. 37MA]|uniref:N-acetylmuramoyl-L-alanine amidase n=1 Tax=Bacillus sp. 37MA TaxID=1132442 RepID=UPI000373BD02|nr:N-acetylmuramoyl-L-alanine amidase [Bacillus sp. 37MA]
MSKHIEIDPGHGGKDPGAVGNGLQEKAVVLDIAKKTAAYLTNNYSCTVSLTRMTDVYHEPEAKARIANTNKADYLVSIHLNSLYPDSNGFETFRQQGVSGETATFQKAVHDEIMSFLKQYGIRDRGIKQQNLAVLRVSNMPAVLTENLFVSNPNEAKLLKDPAVIDGLAKAHADGIAKGAKLERKATVAATVTPGKYRVFTGVFDSKESAEEAAALIKEKVGLNPFIRKEE